ncbi:Spermatogenesis-associated 6 precursor [Schistosoma japonicum]|nr:Spermatogenesis-associated 6 precursor [Schistosoma japonicum]
MVCKIYFCNVQVTLHHVCAPGTRLPGSNSLYLVVEMFNSPKRTELLIPCFPLLLDKTFIFRKPFCSDRRKVRPYNVLNDCKIKIELCEDPDNSTLVKLLAFYSRDVQELFSGSNFSQPCISVTREVFLRRTIGFSGPPIRMKLTIKAFIQQIPVTYCNQINETLCILKDA